MDLSILSETLAKSSDAASMLWTVLAGPERWVFLYLVYLVAIALISLGRQLGREREKLVFVPVEIPAPAQAG